MKQLKFNSGYGGKSVKTSIKRVSKRTLSIVLTILIAMSTMLIGMVSTSAAIDNSGYIYFVKPSSWTDSKVEFMVGHSSYSCGYDMTLVPHTDNLYVCQTSNWGDATEFAFFNTSSNWEGENSTIAHRAQYATHYTATKSNYSLTNGQYYLATPASGTNNATVTMSYFGTSVSTLNNTQTFAVRTAENGSSSYTAPSTSPATVSLSGYYFSSSYNSTTSRTASISKNSSTISSTASIGYLASVTLSYSNLDSNYKFVGWYNSSGSQLSASSSYTYYPTSETTVYARFQKAGHTVSAVAKYQTYDPDTDSYSTIANAPTTVGTATANPTSVPQNSSTTLTAKVVNTNYTFEGWYTNSSCTGNSISSDLTYKVTPTANTTYYALFKEKASEKHTLTVQSADTVTVTAKYHNTNVLEGSSTQVPAGGAVTVNINGIPTNKKCNVSVTSTENVTVSGSGSSYTFKMPDADATVVVTLTDKVQYTVTAKSNNNSYGTVSPTTKTVYEGDSVTITATAKEGYSFQKWTGSGVSLSSSQQTNKTLTLTNIKNDISLTANFTEETGTLVSNFHLIYGEGNNNPTTLTKNLPVYKLSDGRYVARFTNVSLKTNTNYYFAVSGSTSYTGMYWQGESYKNDVYVVSKDTANVNAQYQNYTLNNTEYNFAYFSIKSDDVIGITIVVGVDDGQGHIKEPHYEVIPTIETVPEGTVSIYAKDGTIGSNAKTTSAYGTTTVKTTGDVTLKHTYTGYKEYYAPEGSVIDVTTTINSTYSKDYFIYAFVVDGDSYYMAEKGLNNQYTAEIPIEKGKNDIVEITPIYYTNACKTEGQYITIYVDLKDTDEDDWDETLAGYSYYYLNPDDASTDSKHGDGDWPGQPLLYNEALDKYFCRIPRYMESYIVSGITFNNYNNDTVHSSLFPQSGNEQTYDYAAFKNIYRLGAEVIEFEIHPRSGSKTNRSIVDSGAAFNYETYAKNNGWNVYTTLSGEQSDPLGNPVTPVTRAATAGKKAYIVCVQGDNKAAQGLGEYPIVRYIYDQDGKVITYGDPGDFVPRSDPSQNTAQYKAVQTAGLEGAYTEITYESEYNGRVDGRWYYQMETTITADVKYQTSDNGSDWSTPQEDKAVATINGETSVTFDSDGQNASLVARTLKGYIFAGWATVDDSGIYRELASNLGSSFTTAVDTDVHYVARYVKATTGQLVLTHGKFVGTDAKGGAGYYTISARILRQGGTYSDVVSGTGSGASGQTITLKDVSEADQSVEITLTTTPSGDNTFRYWYKDDGDEYVILNGSAFGKTGKQTYTFTVPVSDLFTDGQQTVNQLDYYSDISPVSREYVLTYKYVDRFGTQKSYVVSGEHDDQYYINNHNSWAPTEELIYENAPAIDDLYKDCKWVVTETSIDGASATLEAVQNEKTYTVKIKQSPDSVADTYSLSLNSYVLNGDSYYVADETYEGQNFAYWKVTEDGKEVARHYSRYFTLLVAGDYEIEPVYGENVEDNLYISDAQYSREQYTDSTGDHDYVYADFIISFLSSNGTLLNENPDYQTGILVEVDRSTVLTDDDIAQGADYSNKSFDSTDSELKRIAQGSDSKTTYNYSSSNVRTVFNFKADNSNYNNMNRLDYFIKFSNTENNRKLVLKAYYYVIKDGEVTLSDPVYFNFYDIGTQSANTGE